MNDPGIIYPVLALITWTFVMWFWMYATRIPAMQRAEVDVDELSRTGAPLELPPDVARVADNYNHLHEQPVLFYALTLSIATLDLTNAWLVGLAWGYVGSRVIHSLIQATANPIMLRFTVFAVGSGLLLALLVSALYLCVAR